MVYNYLTLALVVIVFVLSFFVLRSFFYLRRLFIKSDKKSIENLLEKILAQEEKNKVDIEKLSKKIYEIEKDGKYHIQKLGVVKFNPFKEMGGEHSFSIAILDGKDNGVIITSLHGRERTRVYSKVVRNGKSTLSLSSEEEKALKIAQKI